MFLLWGLIGLLSGFFYCAVETEPSHANSPGDIILGGLFPVHTDTTKDGKTGEIQCISYDLQMFLHSQVMVHAVETINLDSGILPNITLGYDIYDSCGDVSQAVKATLRMMNYEQVPGICQAPANGQQPGSANDQPRVLIGDRYSEISTTIARLTALSLLPQISYASTSEKLSNKFKFPSFLRTVPSDTFQTKGISQLVGKFEWESVAIVGSDDEYGKYGSDGLVRNFQESGICIAVFKILPVATNNSCIGQLIEDIEQSPAEAVILFTNPTNVEMVMTKAIEKGLKRYWIASDTWSTSTKISHMSNFSTVGEVFGFIFKGSEVPGFYEHVASLFDPSTNTIRDKYRSPLWSNTLENSKTDDLCSGKCLNSTCLSPCIDKAESFAIYLAVQVVVKALQTLLKCDAQRCGRDLNFTSHELLEEIKNTNITVNNTNLFFDKNGDPSLGYDIVHWNMSGSDQEVSIKVVGEYWPNQTLLLPQHLIESIKSEKQSFPNCSRTCQPGEKRVPTEISCCYKCEECPDGQVSLGNDTKCTHCDESSIPSGERDRCVEKPPTFFDWTNPYAILLLLFSVSGIIFSVMLAVLFAIHRNTPVVKAIGGYWGFLELLSLLVNFCLTFSLVGQPPDRMCCIAIPIFGIMFTVSMSCILANLLQIMVGFTFNIRVGAWIKKLNHPAVVVIVTSGVQVLVSLSWLLLSPPALRRSYERYTVLYQCDMNIKYFLAMVAYDAFLGLLCFLFAFKCKQLPDLYKNASLITICMVLFFIIWIVFLPIFLSMSGSYKPAISAAAILISSYSIMACHLIPKAYIILFRKELNNQAAITEYIKKHYERKDLSVVQS